jgi:isopentenyl-diphosphate delta-isomerase type 1
MNEEIDIVNEEDEVIGEASREEAHEKGLWHRSASVFVVNSRRQVLVQVRGQNVLNPGKLCASASGHLSKGESYEKGAKRELAEELGIRATLKLIAKYSMEISKESYGTVREHCCLFLCRYDGEFTLQEAEVADVLFFSIDKLNGMIAKDKEQFTPWFLTEFQLYLKYLKDN